MGSAGSSEICRISCAASNLNILLLPWRRSRDGCGRCCRRGKRLRLCSGRWRNAEGTLQRILHRDNKNKSCSNLWSSLNHMSKERREGERKLGEARKEVEFLHCSSVFVFVQVAVLLMQTIHLLSISHSIYMTILAPSGKLVRLIVST